MTLHFNLSTIFFPLLLQLWGQEEKYTIKLLGSTILYACVNHNLIIIFLEVFCIIHAIFSNPSYDIKNACYVYFK